MKPLEISGQRFGKLVAVHRHNTKTPDGKWNWVCRCDCGNTTITAGKRLREGMTKSCGCLRTETLNKNKDRLPPGTYRSGTHNSWRGMFDRCFNEQNAAYPAYGARGITVCERWRKFSAFRADMGTRPPRASLDRINNDGNYEPGNCRWATAKQQQNNRRARRPGYTVTVRYAKEIVCAECGSKHVARSPKRIYCSGACKAAAFRNRINRHDRRSASGP